MTKKRIWVTSFGSSMQYMAAEKSINSCSTDIVKWNSTWKSYVKSYEKSYDKSNVDYRDDDLVNHAQKHTRIKHRYMDRLQIIGNNTFDFESIEQSVLDFPDTEIHR